MCWMERQRHCCEILCNLQSSRQGYDRCIRVSKEEESPSCLELMIGKGRCPSDAIDLILERRDHAKKRASIVQTKDI